MKNIKQRSTFTIPEMYRAVHLALISMDWLKTARKEDALPEDRMERIMLAVTGVNQCPLCSQAHSRMALEKGLDSGEIRKLLQGEDAEIPDKDLKAVLFARHYADTGGAVSEGALQTLAAEYGDTGSAGILGTVRVIMMGNALGIPWSLLLGRLKGIRDARSFPPRDLLQALAVLVIVPAALIHMLFFRLSGKKPPRTIRREES